MAGRAAGREPVPGEPQGSDSPGGARKPSSSSTREPDDSLEQTQWWVPRWQPAYYGAPPAEPKRAPEPTFTLIRSDDEQRSESVPESDDPVVHRDAYQRQTDAAPPAPRPTAERQRLSGRMNAAIAGLVLLIALGSVLVMLGARSRHGGTAPTVQTPAPATAPSIAPSVTPRLEPPATPGAPQLLPGLPPPAATTPAPPQLMPGLPTPAPTTPTPPRLSPGIPPPAAATSPPLPPSVPPPAAATPAPPRLMPGLTPPAAPAPARSAPTNPVRAPRPPVTEPARAVPAPTDAARPDAEPTDARATDSDDRGSGSSATSDAEEDQSSQDDNSRTSDNVQQPPSSGLLGVLGALDTALPSLG
jgi:hypothetical protein